MRCGGTCCKDCEHDTGGLKECHKGIWPCERFGKCKEENVYVFFRCNKFKERTKKGAKV
jgi:hypothetical protein